jgi:hypothetical protein
MLMVSAVTPVISSCALVVVVASATVEIASTETTPTRRRMRLAMDPPD